jgi:hypothetical protein
VKEMRRRRKRTETWCSSSSKETTLIRYLHNPLSPLTHFIMFRNNLES